MYDDDIETRTADANEWDIPDLSLDFKGEKGSVSFHSLEDLSGAQIDRLRSAIGAAKNEGDATNTMYLEAARTLITAWDVPGKANLPIPKGDPKAWGSIPAITRRQIEVHMKHYLGRLMNDNQEDGGDPFASGGPSRPASA